jgi:ribonuclease BN (tRNA processing enzyme)
LTYLKWFGNNYKMEIEVLGCYGNVIGNYRATSFLVNDNLLIDAGTVTEALDDERLKRIKQVVITHTHIDHLKGLFPLVDELAMMGRQYSIELTSAAEIIEIISKNLFNNLIWPDFTVIPSERDAVINLRTIEVEQEARVGGITVKPVIVNHTVYTVGLVVKDGAKGFMFTADTGPTERFWEVARQEKGIEFILADVSFPSRLESMARVSGHMTLSILTEHLDRFGLSDMPVYITHIKPIFLNEILDELARHNGKKLKRLEQGARITL